MRIWDRLKKWKVTLSSESLHLSNLWTFSKIWKKLYQGMCVTWRILDKLNQICTMTGTYKVVVDHMITHLLHKKLCFVLTQKNRTWLGKLTLSAAIVRYLANWRQFFMCLSCYWLVMNEWTIERQLEFNNIGLLDVACICIFICK